MVWMSLNMGHPWVMLMMPASAMWGWPTVVAVLLMWTFKLAAMILPSAAPMLSMFEYLERKRQVSSTAGHTTLAFELCTSMSVADIITAVITKAWTIWPRRASTSVVALVS